MTYSKSSNIALLTKTSTEMSFVDQALSNDVFISVRERLQQKLESRLTKRTVVVAVGKVPCQPWTIPSPIRINANPPCRRVATVLLLRTKKGTERRRMKDRKTKKTVIGTRNFGNREGRKMRNSDDDGRREQNNRWLKSLGEVRHSEIAT